MADSNAVMQAIQQRGAQASQHAIDLASLMGAEMDINNRMASLTQVDANGNTPEMVRQAGIAGLQAQERTIGIAKAMGLNNEGTSDLQYQLATRQQQAIREKMALSDKIGAMEQVGLTDNPLEYILNQWMLPDEYTKYDGAVSAEKQAAASIQELQQSSSAAAVTSNTISEKITQATIESQLAASEASIAKQREAYALQNVKTGAAYTEKLFALSGGELERAKLAYDVQQSEEAAALRRLQIQSIKEERSARISAKETAAAEKAALQTTQLESINASRTKRGEAPYGMEIFLPGGLLSGKGEISKRAWDDYDKGTDMRYGSPVRMGTATETAKILKENPLVWNSPEHKTVARLVADTVTQLEAKGGKKDEIEAKADQAIKQRVADWQNGVGGDKNPLRPLGLTALDQSRAIQESPAWQAYRKLNTNPSPSAELDAADLGAKLKVLMQNREITPEQAGSLLYSIGTVSAGYREKETDLMYLTGERQQHMVVQMPLGKSRLQEASTVAGAALLGMAPLVAAPVSSVPTVFKPSGLGAAFPIKTPGTPVTTPGFSKLAIAQTALGGTLLYAGRETPERIDLLAPKAELIKKAYQMLGTPQEVANGNQ